MAKKSKDSVYEPNAAVLITSASGQWRESQSNPGSFYQEIFCASDEHPITGRSYVDTSMDNYQEKRWQTLIDILNEGAQLIGTGVLRQRSSGEIYLDADHFTCEGVITAEGDLHRVND